MSPTPLTTAFPIIAVVGLLVFRAGRLANVATWIGCENRKRSDRLEAAPVAVVVVNPRVMFSALRGWSAITSSAIIAIDRVVSRRRDGYAGQISWPQYSLAGVGAFIGRVGLSDSAGLPFWPALIAGSSDDRGRGPSSACRRFVRAGSTSHRHVGPWRPSRTGRLHNPGYHRRLAGNPGKTPTLFACLSTRAPIRGHCVSRLDHPCAGCPDGRTYGAEEADVG